MPGAQRVEFLAGNKAARVQAALGALLDDVVDLFTKPAKSACRTVGHLRHVRDET